MSYLTAIAKTRHEILKDNEEPRELHVALSIRDALMRELDPLLVYMHEFLTAEMLMGLHIKWTAPKPLNAPQMSIKTAKGDTRIVNMLAGDGE